MLRVAALCLLTTLPAGAETPLAPDPGTAAFVRANVIGTLYHEFGHALIDTGVLPVPDAEEDAADALSVLLIDRLWSDDEASALIRQIAGAYFLFDARDRGRRDQTWQDSHSLDLQRYYTFVCLFYGADPEAREGLADELDLPVERRESCPEEYQMANDTLGEMLADMPPQDYGPRLRLVVPPDRDALTTLVAAEVRRLNGEYGLRVPVDVTVEPCGEANAFYDPRAKRIVMCSEYADDLATLYREQPD